MKLVVFSWAYSVFCLAYGIFCFNLGLWLSGVVLMVVTAYMVNNLVKYHKNLKEIKYIDRKIRMLERMQKL